MILRSSSKQKFPAHEQNNYMKKLFFTTILFIVSWGRIPVVEAQGTLYVSNTGQTSAGSIPVGSNAWIGGMFFTGNAVGGYSFDSIQLLMGGALGSPSNFAVMLYSYNMRFPGSSLGSLNGSSDPAAGGVFSYSSSGIVLSPSTPYWIVAKSATATANGSYNWSFANTTDYSSAGTWQMNFDIGYYASSIDSLAWTIHGVYPLQFAVYATPIPEPSAISLLLLASAIVFCARRSSKQDSWRWQQ